MILQEEALQIITEICSICPIPNPVRYSDVWWVFPNASIKMTLFLKHLLTFWSEALQSISASFTFAFLYSVSFSNSIYFPSQHNIILHFPIWTNLLSSSSLFHAVILFVCYLKQKLISERSKRIKDVTKHQFTRRRVALERSQTELAIEFNSLWYAWECVQYIILLSSLLCIVWES